MDATKHGYDLPFGGLATSMFSHFYPLCPTFRHYKNRPDPVSSLDAPAAEKFMFKKPELSDKTEASGGLIPEDTAF
jgi:hypothetical protein